VIIKDLTTPQVCRYVVKNLSLRNCYVQGLSEANHCIKLSCL